MNNKQTELYRILDNVVLCCATQVDDKGTLSVTKDDVLSKARNENVVMTRCILVNQILAAGYSVSTAAMFINRTVPAIRHLMNAHFQFLKQSRAYRIANAEATLKCKDIVGNDLDIESN